MHPTIACSNGHLLVSTLDGSCLLYRLSHDTTTPALVLKSEQTADKQVDLEAKGVILYARFSNSGKYMAICNDYKQILLYATDAEDCSEWKLSSTRPTPKKGVKIEFVADDSSFVVADKFGDVTLFSVSQPEKEGDVVLGHLSMLLDCLFLSDGKYLATADRDEKIRVSCFPDTYEIQAFCLGHTKYVTCLVEAEQWLVSGSGDGSVRLWDPLTGQLLSQIVCSEEGQAVHQLLYLRERRAIMCLVTGSSKLLYISITSEEGGASLSQDVTEQELAAPAIALCQCHSSVIALLDSMGQPLQVVESDSKLILTSGIGADIGSRWASFAGAMKCQQDFYTNLTKMNMENVDEELARKGKRVPPHIKKNGSKVLKLAV